MYEGNNEKKKEKWQESN